MKLCNGKSLAGPKLHSRVRAVPYFGIDDLKHPIPGTVDYVNEAHGFYTVRFDAGYRQSYHFMEAPHERF